MLLILYQLLYPVIAAVILLRILLAGRSQALREGWPEIRQRCGLPAPGDLAGIADGDVVWIHAASVGEVLAAAPLIRLIAKEKHGPRVLITTSTVTGRERARRIDGVAAAVLLPMDFLPAVAAFIGRSRARSLILMEKEFWPMLLRTALRRGIRIGIANGRITERSAKRYARIGSLLEPSLARVERAAAQTDADADRFHALGIPAEAIAATGNMKYDFPLPTEDALAVIRRRIDELGWTKDPLWAAGSTRRGEEELIIEAHKRAAKKIPGLRLLLAPRHIERTQEVATLLRAAGLRFNRWSQLMPFQSEPECLLIDQLGVLGALYSAARAAFVGGTLVPVGGHNLLEPALLARPVLYGPYTTHTQAPADALQATGGGLLVKNAEELFTELLRLLEDEKHREDTGKKALATAESFTGATRRTYVHLLPLLQG